MTLNPYLNFDGNAEEAFRFYQSVFGGELFIQKMNQAPGTDDLPENEKNRIMHVGLPIGNGQYLMASDCLPSQGHILKQGNNNYISVSPDSREDLKSTRLNSSHVRISYAVFCLKKKKKI